MMKREFQFKAWNKKHEKWLTEKDHHVLAISFDGSVLFCYDDSCESQIDYIEEVVLLQKTGMQDKNGKDIWEGDIMNWNGKINALVKWSIPNGGFMLLLPNGDTRPFCYDVIYDREVLGNLYENPELLRDVAAIA